MSYRIESGLNQGLQSLFPRDGTGRIIWSTFGGDQEKINQVIEQETSRMLGQEKLLQVETIGQNTV